MLTRTFVYALRALLHLAQQPEDDYHQTAVVASRIAAPTNYLGKILQKLARARIVDSQKGLHGGFRLARLPENVSLLDVFDAIDGRPTVSVGRLPNGDSEGEDGEELAGVDHGLAKFERLYTRFLRNTTLEDLLTSGTREIAEKPIAFAARNLVQQPLSSEALVCQAR